MKTFKFLLLFISITASAFSQYPFSNCWLFQDTTIAQGFFSSIKLDSTGRVFMSVYDNGAYDNIVLDENGNKISTSPYPFSAVAKSGNYYRWYSITDTDSTTSAVIEKVNPFNDLIWSDTIGYGNNVSDNLSVFNATDEKLLVAGSSYFYYGETTSFISKYDETGNVEWNIEIGTNNGKADYPGMLTILSTGNYLLQGSTTNFQVGGDITVTNITTDGQILWHTTLNSLYYPAPSGLVEENNGACYVLTTTIDLDNPYANQLFNVDHLDENGVKTPGTQYFYDQNISTAIKDSKGNLLISSWVDYYGDPEGLALRKIDSGLNILWEQYDYQPNSDNIQMVVDSQDNSYWLIANGGDHGTLYKYDTYGTLEWQLLKTGSNSDYYYPMELDLRKDEHLLLLGRDGPVFESSILMLESIDLNSTLEWEAVLDTVESPVYASLVKRNDDEYYLPGKYYASPNQQGHFCLKLCVTLATGFQSPALTDLYELYPNPVSQSATVSFSLNEESPVVMEIMDVNGRSLRVIAKKDFSEGNHEVTFNLESLIAGIYFLQLKTNEEIMMKKMVIE